MADLRDGLLRAIQAKVNAGYGLSLIAAGHPWQCCEPARTAGPMACTCWQPLYDRDQVDPDLDAHIAIVLGQAQPEVRHRMCADCAYRPGSPERTGDPGMEGSPEQMEALAETGTRFWCHDGMRVPIAWRHHRAGQIPAIQNGDYQPPIIEGIPCRADGRPGLLCAGWNARHRALQAKTD